MDLFQACGELEPQKEFLYALAQRVGYRLQRSLQDGYRNGCAWNQQTHTLQLDSWDSLVWPGNKKAHIAWSRVLGQPTIFIKQQPSHLPYPRLMVATIPSLIPMNCRALQCVSPPLPKNFALSVIHNRLTELHRQSKRKPWTYFLTLFFRSAIQEPFLEYQKFVNRVVMIDFLGSARSATHKR